MPDPGPATPFIHRRRIRFGESDPAGIAYTARFGDFAMEAVESFFLDRLGAGFYELNRDHGVGTPFVHLSFDFRSPLTPRDTLATAVILARMGGGSLTFRLEGRVGDRLAFEAKAVCAFCDTRGPELVPIRIPEAFRAALQRDADHAAAPPPEDAAR